MNLNLIPVLCNQKNMENYAYILHDDIGSSIVIDAAETEPVVSRLEELNLKPSYILTTHHHFDHVGGNLDLKEKYKLKIIAPEEEFDKVPGADIPARDGVPLPVNFCTVTPFLTPGHTNGHVIYYIKETESLFTGDVLFNLCIGGLFEGTPEQMFESLQKIKSFPDNTKIFPGHEYTRSCLANMSCKTPEAENYIRKMLIREQGGVAPALLKEEKSCNPYLKARTLDEF